MGALLLLAAYGLTGLALAWVVGRLLPRGPSLPAFLVLSLLPLAFTATGFLKGKVLGPTATLAGVPPWCHPDLVESMREGSSPTNDLLLDPLSQMETWRQAARGDLLLNPSANSGGALLANGQSAALFPLEVVARQLPPVRATTYAQAARLLLAAWGMFLLLRSLAVSETGSLLGAAVYVGCGFLQVWRLHPHSYVAALAPWILWAMLRLVRRPGGRGAVALGIAGALAVFAGHPETLLHTLVFGGLVVGLLLVTGPRRMRGGRPLLRLGGWAVAAALLAFLLAAPALLPFLENLPVSFEYHHRQTAEHQDLEKPWLWALPRVLPAFDFLALGDPFEGTWIGPENLAEIGGTATALAALALLPAALSSRRHRRRAWVFFAVGLLGLLVGSHFAWISKPFGWVPVLEDSLAKRLYLWWVLAVPVLSAFGFEHLRRLRPAPLFRGRRASLAGLVALGGILAAVGTLVPAERTPASLALPGLALLLAVPALLALRRRAGRALLFALVLGQQVLLLGRWVPEASALSYYPETPAVTFARERVAGYRVAGLDSALVPHSAAFFGLEDIRGYDPMIFEPYAEFLRPLGAPMRSEWMRFTVWHHPLLDFLGVRYLFDHATMYVFHHREVEQVYAGEDALVYENPRAFERLFRPAEVEVLGAEVSERKVVERAREIGDFAALALASGPGLPPPGRYPNGALRIEEIAVGSGELTARAEASSLALLATSQPAIPGWRAWIDGEPAPPVRVNGAFLGLVLGEGSHRVRFAYRPRSWAWGWGLFAGGLALAACAGIRRPTR